MNRDEIEKLLDGTTPGPWVKEDTFGVRGSDDNYVANFGFGPDTDEGDATAEKNAALGAAAPDLARTALDALARLENAEAAQALVVERAVALINPHPENAENDYCPHNVYLVAHPCEECAEARIRALAPASGVAALAALRAERDDLKQKLISPDPYEDTAHFDDHAVNRFAAVMKGKLASKRLQGRGGWQEPEVPNGYLSRLLREHVDKGDPVDVANFAMMIHQRGERIATENEGASCKAIDKAEAERDDALTRLAAAEAQVGAMEKALTSIVESDDMAAELFTNDKDRADNHADRARAALASAAGGAK